MYMIWLGRVIFSNYFDTTFDEYCFTDDVTGAGIVTERAKYLVPTFTW